MSKKIVIPGELVSSERKRLGSNVFLKEGKIYSNALGFVQEDDLIASVVPLEGVYTPQVGDLVVGIVSGEKFAVFEVDINHFLPCFVPKRDIRESLPLQSFVSAKIFKIDELNEVDLGNIRVLFGGEVFGVKAIKVPRVIGRNGSMLDVLKKWTGSNFLVGRNGKIWVKGGNVELLKKAVKMIELKAHKENLTNLVSEFLEKESKTQKAGD